MRRLMSLINTGLSKIPPNPCERKSYDQKVYQSDLFPLFLFVCLLLQMLV